MNPMLMHSSFGHWYLTTPGIPGPFRLPNFEGSMEVAGMTRSAFLFIRQSPLAMAFWACAVNGIERKPYS